MHHKTRQTALHLALLLLTVTTAKAQFDIEDSHTTANLRGVSNVGGGVVWASGENGTVRRSEDEGYLWQLCTIPPGAEKLDFRGIQAFDANTAIVMSSGKGDLSRLYKTTDGCQTWKLIFTNPDKEGFWDAMQFDSPHPSAPAKKSRINGVLIGDPIDGKFVIYTTQDSGNDWRLWGPQKSFHPAEANPEESLFAASNSSVVSPGVNGPFAFVTGGSGGSRLFLAQPHSPLDVSLWWAFTTIKLSISSNATSGAFSVAARRIPNNSFADLMVVGGNYQIPESTGAAVFIPSRSPARNLFSSPAIAATHPPHGYRSSVAYEPTTKTWITVGPNGTDISTDDGRNWRALKPNLKDSEAPDADKNWNALSLPFVVGPHGRIGKLRTNDLTSKSKGVQ